MLLVLSVISLGFIWWIFISNSSAEVKSFTYEIEENNDELIFEVQFQFSNESTNSSYANIVLDSFFYEYIKNPESIEPIPIKDGHGVSGSTRIIINKEDFTSDFIELLKSKDRNPFRAITIGEEIDLYKFE